jgi:hypothetical protein
MRKHHVHFNHERLTTEVVPFSLADYVRWFAWRLGALTCIAAGSIFTFDTFFESPKSRSQAVEIAFLTDQVKHIDGQMAAIEGAMNELGDRDEEIYRNIFGATPYPAHLRDPGMGGSDRFRDLRGHDHSEVVTGLRERIGSLERRIVAQDASFKELADLASDKEEMLQSIPAIQPVRNSDLKRMASGYGMRLHPIYKVRKMHWGMDFSAPTGSEIFATGDGVVVQVKRQYNGFGRHIRIKHGFGFETLYAHMSKTLVRKGQKVKRGDLIGLVGNTGTSVAPHLHYEVKKGDRRVNPAHYYFNDLTPEQYEAMLIMSENPGQSFD